LRWLIAAAASLVLLLLLMALPPLLTGPVRWNWAGHALALSVLLAIAWRLVRDAGMSWSEMGFARRQRAGSVFAAAAATLALLALQAMLVMRAGAPAPVTPEDLWFQATMPGLFEESLFRGLLPALVDRAFSARWRVAGAELGWGALIASLLFLALHARSGGALLGVLPLALVLPWLRARTGSLLWPVFLHNGWNALAFALKA
jgi:hypothetical protein